MPYIRVRLWWLVSSHYHFSALRNDSNPAQAGFVFWVRKLARYFFGGAACAAGLTIEENGQVDSSQPLQRGIGIGCQPLRQGGSFEKPIAAHQGAPWLQHEAPFLRTRMRQT